MKSITYLLLIFIWCVYARESTDTKGDLFNDISASALTIITGVIEEIPKITPSMDQLFRLPIQAFVGLPEVKISEALSQLCSVYLASGEIRPRITPNISEMAFLLSTNCQNESFPLLEAETILRSPNFDMNKKLVLYVSGWMAVDNSATELGKAFNCRGDYNFLYLDAANFIHTLYTWSAVNTEEIGRNVAIGLTKLIEEYPLENIHLIGHSLGAQIVGYAGQYFQKLTGGKLIPRITGLDPANPCYQEGEVLYGIQRGDAEFIEIIHANPGVLGKKHPVGDADFYAGGLAPIKPGCYVLPCSHTRAWQYYAETVYPGNEGDFLGVRCTSLTKLEDGFCDGEGFPMGIDVPLNLKGNYFFGVNINEPYGKNATNSFMSSKSECGSCD